MPIWLTCCAWSASNPESSIFADMLSELENSIGEVGRVLSARDARLSISEGLYAGARRMRRWEWL